MYLVADKARADVGNSVSYLRWENFPNSYLSNHGAACCETARQWFRAMDFAQSNGGLRSSGPRWIRQKYNWGPSAWPLHWCEALAAESIDCGAHAALAEEAFRARGVTTFRAQFVQRYDANATSQWRKRWSADEASDHWLAGDHIYHEGNAVQIYGNEIKLWDGSAGSWMNPSHAEGYGSVIAVRLASLNEAPQDLKWGDHSIRTGNWTVVAHPIETND